MIFDWKDYQTLAQQLADSDGEDLSEAKFRAAISRYYYYLFNISRKYWENEGYEFESYQIHKQIISKFTQSQPGLRMAGSLLSNIRKERVIADYKDRYDNIERQWKKVLSMGKQMNNILKDHNNNNC